MVRRGAVLSGEVGYGNNTNNMRYIKMVRKYEVEIKGVSPYLMHRFGEEEADKSSQIKSGKKDYKSEAIKALYKSPEGEIYVPNTQLHMCLVEAGKEQRIPGGGKKTYSKLYGAFLIIDPFSIPMLNQNYEIDERPVVVQRARVIRYRPIFKEWGLKFVITVMEDNIPEEALKEGLDRAGSYVGIGDFRPQKKGPFGRFIVTSFKELEDE